MEHVLTAYSVSLDGAHRGVPRELREGATLRLHPIDFGASPRQDLHVLHVPVLGGNERRELANLRNRQVVFGAKPQQGIYALCVPDMGNYEQLGDRKSTDSPGWLRRHPQQGHH